VTGYALDGFAVARGGYSLKQGRQPTPNT